MLSPEMCSQPRTLFHSPMIPWLNTVPIRKLTGPLVSSLIFPQLGPIADAPFLNACNTAVSPFLTAVKIGLIPEFQTVLITLDTPFQTVLIAFQNAWNCPIRTLTPATTRFQSGWMIDQANLIAVTIPAQTSLPTASHIRNWITRIPIPILIRTQIG